MGSGLGCLAVRPQDNGGPGEDANNLPLRGAKFGTFEGGVRGAAMIHSPLLPESTRGTVSNCLIHLTDWHATFAALAGVSTENTGPVPPDGHNVWPALASGGSVPSPRTFIIHEYDKLEGIYAFRSVRFHPLSSRASNGLLGGAEAWGMC